MSITTLNLLDEFTSEGSRGFVRKIVEYVQTGAKNVYNLGFGDLNESDTCIDDLIVTDNGDSLKVLATVASTVYEFTSKYPDAFIFAIGSTKSRTRLYRIGITRNLIEIQEEFVIFGSNDFDVWEKFVTGRNYNAFFLTRKENRRELWQQLKKLSR